MNTSGTLQPSSLVHIRSATHQVCDATSPCLGFLICKMGGVMRAAPASRDRCEK